MQYQQESSQMLIQPNPEVADSEESKTVIKYLSSYYKYMLQKVTKSNFSLLKFQ